MHRPELYLSASVGGFWGLQLNRNFRNEGISPRHNPEFTMLEAYEAFGSWETMATRRRNDLHHRRRLFGGLRSSTRTRTARFARQLISNDLGGAFA
jgi:lysyl-tRNA synthetase class II